MDPETYNIAEPTAPGEYESASLGAAVIIRVNGNGSADAIVTRYGTTYETAILDLGHYAASFGPFRRLDDTDPVPPTSASAPDDQALIDIATAQAAATHTEEQELSA